ncbi:protein-disulfide reductase DsbD family protein [Aerosakkonemataceae cyanobacterium BLCC-F154]|uniref:Protein-disulfide reductase DsbD family protein n=1 Tax=Floridaenema fluviatile BLCC-F154 TaxID=3153640 RepID=A0ABV4YJ74_9CYAN
MKSITYRIQKWLIICTATLFLVWNLLGIPNALAATNQVKTNNVQTQLISENKAIQPGKPFWVALQMKIRPGWHTYWQNPGDSGSITKINWQLPAGFKPGKILWPYPQRFPFGPLVNFGYKNEVYLLTQITPPANLPTNKPVLLRGKADWLVCEKDCIPESSNISLTLPITSTTPAKDERWITAFAKTRQAIPKPAPWQTTATANDTNLTLKINAPELQAGQIQEVSFFPFKDGVINNPAPQKLNFTKDGLTLNIERGYQPKLSSVDGVLVIQEKLDNQSATQAFNIQAKIGATAPTPPKAATTTSSISVWQAIFFALIGGIVLNLMPCVFPVLSLKALSIAQTAQKSAKEARISGVAFTAGVLVSFAVLAIALLTLRSFGQQIGWGFQLQSPIIVMLLAYILFAVGLSLSGVFVFGASLMGIGQNLAAKNGYTGEFFTGIFATVMATPCSAPFMATAIGVALIQPPPVAVGILLVLGFGLALPYLTICFVPALRRKLPKPGAWMETFSQFLAFPMYGAAAWLVWVLTLQTGSDGLAAVLTGFVLIGFAAWLYQKAQTSGKVWRRIGIFGALVAIVLALTLAPLAGNSTLKTAQQTTQNSIWQPYTAEKLTEIRQSGKPVFVNFSASWCITCLVNERVALSQPEVQQAFQQKGVTLMKADWTNRNATITKALSSFGRSGVPLYVLYPSGTKSQEPIVLPQVLTPDIIRNTLNQI